jgi:hypothetical protein
MHLNLQHGKQWEKDSHYDISWHSQYHLYWVQWSIHTVYGFYRFLSYFAFWWNGRLCILLVCVSVLIHICMHSCVLLFCENTWSLFTFLSSGSKAFFRFLQFSFLIITAPLTLHAYLSLPTKVWPGSALSILGLLSYAIHLWLDTWWGQVLA